MAIFQLPLAQDVPWFDFVITLSNVRYGMEARYNTRSERWHLDINDALQNPLVTGVPMLTGRSLCGQYTGSGLPPGDLVVIDTTNKGQPATLRSFLSTHVLLYIEPGTAL